MSKTIHTKGTQLMRGDGAEPTEMFSEVPGIISVEPIPAAAGRPLLDRTTLADTMRQHEFGLPDMPEVACGGWFDPDEAQHAGLIADHHSGTVRNFQLRIPTDPVTIYQFSALVSVEIGGVAVDGRVTMNVTLKPQTLLTELVA